VPGYTDIQPERTGNDFGQDMWFKYISNDHEVVKKVWLAVKLAPLAAAGGGTQPRYPDDVLCQAIEWAEVTIGGTALQRLWGDEIHAKQMRTLIPDDLANAYKLQRAGLLVADRVDLANVATHPDGFWVWLQMPFWFTETANKHWHQYACQRTTRIQFHFRGPEYILQQTGVNQRPLPTGGSALYIKDAYLRFAVSALSTDVKGAFVKTIKDFGNTGISYLFTYDQRQENNIVPAGSLSNTIQLTNFNKPTVLVLIMVRKEADMLPNYLRNQRFIYQPLGTFWADASGHRLNSKVVSDFAKYAVNAEAFPGSPDPNVYYMYYSDYPDVVQFPMGNIEFGRLQNPTVTLQWDAATPENYQVDFFAKCYNYIRLVISAEGRSGIALEQPI
jgi:hypothetical protein